MSIFKKALFYALGVALILIFALFSLSIGRYEVGFSDILSLIFNSNKDLIIENIIFELRAPRIILAIFIGASLSLAGASFQSLFSNPLASPDILGVTSGASFGAVLALLLGLSGLYVGMFGIIFGILSLILVLLISFNRYQISNMSMILSGIIIGALFQSLIGLVKYLADPQDVLPTITYWLLGSLEASLDIQTQISLSFIFIASLVIFLLKFKLDILNLNEDYVKTLGVNLTLLRVIIILSCTIIVSFSVSLSGIIGWVGLLVPHIARLIVGSSNVKIIPFSILIGAIFLMLIDLLSRTISQSQIPISILTALIGSPIFIYILHKYKKEVL